MQKVKLISQSELGLYIYAISGFGHNELSLPFLKGLSCNALGESSCTSYGYKKLLSAKINKVTLSGTYKYNLMARLWSVFQDDVPVKRLTINVNELNYIK